MSPLSNTATSAVAHPPTLWVPPWSSAVIRATPWSRALSSLSVLTHMTHSGMRRSQPAEVSTSLWMGLPGAGSRVGTKKTNHRARGRRGPLTCMIQAAFREGGDPPAMDRHSVGRWQPKDMALGGTRRGRASRASPAFQPCAAGRSLTQRGSYSPPTGRSPTAVDRIASGVCT